MYSESDLEDDSMKMRSIALFRMQNREVLTDVRIKDKYPCDCGKAKNCLKPADYKTKGGFNE